jgi:hypothetical protein
MRIEISRPDLVADLLSVLHERRDCVAVRDGNAIEAALIGSFADGGADELEALVRDWRRDHPGVDVEFAP